MRIGQVAAEAAVNVQTLRYYERRGLIPAARRRASGYREYDPTAVGRVRFIKHAQALGFSLDDIRQLLADTACAHVQARAERAIARIDEKVAELARMRSVLIELTAHCAEQNGAGDCHLLQALECSPSN
jgi:MerR family transcriptional regulator, copper efflux regulator